MAARPVLQHEIVLVQRVRQGCQVIHGGIGAGEGDTVLGAADAVKHADGQVGMRVEGGGGDGRGVGGWAGGKRTEGAEYIQAAAQAQVNGLHPAHGQPGHGAAAAVVNIHGIAFCQRGQQVVSQLLVEAVEGRMILGLARPAVGRDHDERLDFAAVDQVVHDPLHAGVLAGHAPFVFAAADAVAEDEQVVGLGSVVAVGQVHERGLLIRLVIVEQVVGLVGEFLDGSAILAGLGVFERHIVLIRLGALGADGGVDIVLGGKRLPGLERAASLKGEIQVVHAAEADAVAVFLGKGMEHGAGDGLAVHAVREGADGELVIRRGLKPEHGRACREIQPAERNPLVRLGSVHHHQRGHLQVGIDGFRLGERKGQQQRKQGCEPMFHLDFLLMKMIILFILSKSTGKSNLFFR